MIRRSILVTAAAVALILAPSAAMAYDAPGYGSSVSDSTPVAGQSITVTVTGLPNEMIKLVVTSASGVQTYSKRTNSDGKVTFTFTAGAAGIITVQAFNAAGKMVSDQTITVLAASGEKLSDTGFDGMGLAAGGGGLVLLGAGAVLVARRRRSAQVNA